MINSRPSKRLFCGALSWLLLAFSSSPALAAESVVPDPAAVALFESGRALVEKGDWAAGCPKFEASLMVYPAPSTLLNLAHCYEHDGKLAEAWSAYKRALVLNQETPGVERKQAFETIANEGIAKLEPKVPRLKIVVEGAPAGLSVTRNGEEVLPAMFGTSIPINPGPQTITAQAPGYQSYRKGFTAVLGASEEVRIHLEPSSGEGAPGHGRIPLWTWVAAGGGLALGVAAAGFRVDQALVEGRQGALCKGDVERGCPPPSEYDPMPDNARKNRDFYLFVGLSAGSVLALSAAVTGMILGTSHSSERSRAARAPLIVPWVGPSVAGFSWGGRFE